jgi:hypothetical protein
MAFGRKKREKAQALVETGSKAVAVLLSVHDTGITMNDNPRIKMRFRLEPLDGSPAFEGEKTNTVSRLTIPRPGDRFAAWYDPTDQDTWAFATVNDDQGRQQIRAMFGAAAETLTGVGDPAAAAGAAPATPAAPANGGAPDALAQLEKLGELRAAGVLTEEEFAAKKAQLLAQL